MGKRIAKGRNHIAVKQESEENDSDEFVEDSEEFEEYSDKNTQKR